MPGDGSGGSRSSCSRQAGTGVSTVTQMAAKPLASARATRSRVSSRSVNQYSWNHGLVTVGPTSSNRTLAPELMTIVVPRASAARAVASSASGCAKRWRAVGANRIGSAIVRPRTVIEVSMWLTSMSAALPEPPARVRLDVAAGRRAGPGRAGDEVVALDRHPLPRERLELLHREDPRQLLRLEIGRPSAHLVDHVPTSFVCQPASFLYLIRCGWSAAVPELAVAELLVLGEVALEPADLAVALEREHVRRDPVEEPAIVADDDGAAGERLEAGLERPERVDVEVVGRFVEQQDVAARLQQLGQVDAVPLAAGQLADGLLLVRAAEVEARHVGAGGQLAGADLDELVALGDLVEDRLVGGQVVAALVDVAQLDGVADRDRSRRRAAPAPTIIRNSVVLPAPFAPMIPTMPAFGSEKVRSSMRILSP